MLPSDSSVCGIPIMPEVEVKTVPSLGRLIEIFDYALINREKLDQRERLAVAACAITLANHFPSVWEALPVRFQVLLEYDTEEEERLIKLRRISASYLARYL